VVVERSSQTAQAVIVANSTTPDPLNALFRLIRERLADELHSLWFNSHLEPSNAVLGPYFERWCGPPSVVEHFGGALSSAPAIHYPPGAFGQSNLEIAEDIIVHIRSLIPEGASVAEFYAGVGAIGLSILDRVRELRVNELNPHSLAGLELGVAGLSPADRAKVSIVAGPAAIECGMAASADVVIADPPRKGLDAPLLEYLVTHPPRRIVYVSCGLASLLADTARLTTGSKLKLTALAAFNLMPFTEHVETVALFECEQR